MSISFGLMEGRLAFPFTVNCERNDSLSVPIPIYSNLDGSLTSIDPSNLVLP